MNSITLSLRDRWFRGGMLLLCASLLGLLLFAGVLFSPSRSASDQQRSFVRNNRPPESSPMTFTHAPQQAAAELLSCGAVGAIATESSSIIRLNVGGVKYQTSMQTLTAVPGSVLEEMFNDEENPLPIDEDGSFFIDRDGHAFTHILNFLRDGALPSWELPLHEAKVLRQEAAYFGIAEMEAWAGERLRDRHFTAKDLKTWIQVAQSGAKCTLDLRGLDGSGQDLEGIPFPSCRILARGSNFHRASLAQMFTAPNCGYDFSQADFGHANMGGAAVLTGGDFSQANFMGASMKGAIVEACYSCCSSSFTRTLLSRADLSDAHFGGSLNATLADLSFANLEGSTFSGGASIGPDEWDRATGIWVQANFTGANLKKAKFTLLFSQEYIHIMSLNFSMANFAGADMQGSRIQVLPNDLSTWFSSGSNQNNFYRMASFENTVFDGANMAEMSMKLAGEEVKMSIFRYAVELAISFCGASFMGTNLTSAFFQGGVFDNLAGADLKQAKFEQTLFLPSTSFNRALLEDTVFQECFVVRPAFVSHLKKIFSSGYSSPYFYNVDPWSSYIRPLQLTDLAGSLQTEKAILIPSNA